MSFHAIKGGVLVFVGGAVILAAALLVILQWGNTAELTAYGPQVQANTMVLMLCSAAGGLVLIGAVKLFWVGGRILRQARKEAAAREVVDAARTLRDRGQGADQKPDAGPTP